jgi:hypothetical protein
MWKHCKKKKVPWIKSFQGTAQNIILEYQNQGWKENYIR